MSVTPPAFAPEQAAALGQLFDTLAPGGGQTRSALDGLCFIRSGMATAQAPGCEPCIAIAVSAQPYCTILPAPLPLEPPDWADNTRLRAILLRIDVQAVAELLLALDRAAPNPHARRGAARLALDATLADTVLRLLRALRSAADTRVLAPGIARELLYRVLTGPLGWAVHAALRRHGQAGRIGKALRRIHEGYGAPVDVATLARDAGMSVTAFHAHFKAVTGTTPIQYLKATRLHKARLLMAQDGISAAAASHLVGYESCSQFSREFKRQFGRPPGCDAALMRRALRSPAALDERP